MIGRIEETSASFEARSYPTTFIAFVERQIGFSFPFSSLSWRNRFISGDITPVYFLRQLL